jgi:acyl carrier protein
MDQQEIETKVTEILMNKLGISETVISFESTLKDLGADSLEQIEIITDLEKEFGITIPDDITPEVQNIGSLCKYIENEISLHSKINIIKRPGKTKID